MIVANKMTKNPYCINSDTTISEALHIMKTNHFHRIPVVDNGRLVGLITEGVIRANTPSQATALSIHEINYLLSKTTVNSIMIKDMVTINSCALLEEAATLMRKNDIGCLPVVDSNQLVGIITQNDIFDAFIDILGYHRPGYRFVISNVDDKPGQLDKIANCFFSANANISNMVAYHQDKNADIVIIADNLIPADLKSSIENLGFVVSVNKN